MAANVSQILSRWGMLKNERAFYESLRDEIAEVIDPWRGHSSQQIYTPGDKRTTKIFDSTAMQARKLLASTLHATLTPATQPWLSFSLRQSELNELSDVQAWKEEAAKRMHLALRQSNFGTAVNQMYNDLVGPAATGCLFVEEKDPPSQGTFGGFRFTTYSPARYCIAEDYDGGVDTVFIDAPHTARALVARFRDAVGEKVLEKAKDKPEEKFTLLHAVFPRSDLQYQSDGRTPKKGSRNLPWASCYVIVETKHKVDEGGFHERAFIVPRWDKATGEVYGNGPSHIAAPDVRTLNAVKEFLLKAAPLAMFPPTIERDDAVLGDPDLTPAGRNTVSGAGPISDLFGFMQTGLKIDLSQIILNDLRNSILETYFIPQLRLKDRPEMTATEVQARLEEMFRFLGPTLARLETEFLNPLIERCFALMARARALPAMPPALIEAIQEADLDIEYEGPLARAQRVIELTAQERVISFVSAVVTNTAEIRPDIAKGAWDVLDVDQMIRDRAAVAGMPSDELKRTEDVDAIRQQRAEDEAQQAQMQQVVQGAEAAGRAAPMLQALDKAANPQGKAA